MSDIDLSKTGTYQIVLDDGQAMDAWFNPQTSHWIKDGKEIGFGYVFFANSRLVSAEFLGEYY